MRIVLSFVIVAPLFIGASWLFLFIARLNVPVARRFLLGMLLALFAIAGTRFLILPMIKMSGR